MARTYSEEFITLVDAADPSRTGIILAKVCLKANLPAKYIAVAMNVSRMTIYSWFRGKAIRDKNQELVKVFIAILEDDLDRGVLPVNSIEKAKLYIEEIVGTALIDAEL
jgi:hypothetical protein